MAVKRWIRYQYLKLMRIDGVPSKVAMGMAVGVFLGIFPTFGIGTVLAFILAVIFGFNKVAAVIGSLIMNPLTAPFFWGGSAILGAMLTGDDWRLILKTMEAFSQHFTIHGFLTKDLWMILLGAAKKGLYLYLIGNLIISTLFTILAYFLTLKLTGAYRRRKAAWLDQKAKSRGLP